MKVRRRKFIKKSFGIAAGILLLPPVLFNKLDSVTKANTIKPANKPNPLLWKDDEINIAWIGHSTVLMNFYGTLILTDPVLFDRIGINIFGLTYGPTRLTAPALEIDEIPQPDLILLSHSHMDHTDLETLSHLTEKFPRKIDCVTAFNTIDVVEDLEWKTLHELDWDAELTIQNIRIKALEVQHFGWRFPWERDRSKGFLSNGRSYNAYILEKNDKKILFGGDTAFHDKFEDSKAENIDIAIMPIGAYNPYKKWHCNPEEALTMASFHLDADHFIPIHCSTFKQGREPIEEPLQWLEKSKSNYSINIGISDIGETFTLRN